MRHLREINGRVSGRCERSEKCGTKKIEPDVAGGLVFRLESVKWEKREEMRLRNRLPEFDCRLIRACNARTSDITRRPKQLVLSTLELSWLRSAEALQDRTSVMLVFISHSRERAFDFVSQRTLTSTEKMEQGSRNKK